MDGGSRYLLESGDRHGLVRIDDVEQMMRNRRLLVRGRFGRADVHAAVHLVGVRVHYLGPLPPFLQRPGDGDAEAGLAGRGRPDDADDPRHRHGRVC